MAVIIDSTSSMIKKERSILDIFEDITHGQVVSAVLRKFGQPDDLRFYNVDNMRGAVDSSRYIDALTQTKSYLQEGQDDRVVVNISLGSYSPTPQETKLITDILELGAIVVAAAGNDGVRESSYPASIDGVICVGASINGIRSHYSNYGGVDIFADGSYRTAQTVPFPSDIGIETHSRSVELNGTSFAAPKVTGVIVKMLQLYPSL
jgi:subtilisin family serine protease